MLFSVNKTRATIATIPFGEWTTSGNAVKKGENFNYPRNCTRPYNKSIRRNDSRDYKKSEHDRARPTLLTLYRHHQVQVVDHQVRIRRTRRLSLAKV